MKKYIALSLWISFLLTTSCFGGGSDANSISKEVAGNNDFAIDLYGKMKDDSKDNLFFSPYSISTALAMTYGGARGQTRKQMAAALHFTLSDEQLYAAFGSLQKQIIASEKTPGCWLLMANALWLQKKYPFLEEFLDLTAAFEAGRFQLDFVSEPEKSRQAINNWIKEQTQNRIGDMIPHDGITEETRLVISNAVYFIGEWKNKFDISKTKEADFYLSTKKTVNCRLMNLHEKFKYYSGKALQVIELPYKSEQLSMLIILPVQKQGLKELERTLTAKMLNEYLSKMAEKEVGVFLPKFKITWGTFSLNKSLEALGMPDAFEPEKANFSGMTGNKDLWISDVFHKAFVEVNEEGTEATASTAVILTQEARPELFTFRADHPFIFMIRDNRSGSILFMGRMMNPTTEE